MDHPVYSIFQKMVQASNACIYVKVSNWVYKDECKLYFRMLIGMDLVQKSGDNKILFIFLNTLVFRENLGIITHHSPKQNYFRDFRKFWTTWVFKVISIIHLLIDPSICNVLHLLRKLVWSNFLPSPCRDYQVRHNF